MLNLQNIGASDFGQLLTGGGGGNAAPASGGFNFANLLGGGGAAGAGSASGLLSMAAGFVPGGGLALAGLNLLSGVFGGGGTPMAATQFDNLHSPTLPPLDATRMKAPTADIYVRHARAWGISVEEVMALLKADQARNNAPSFDYVQDAWAYGPNGSGQVDMPHMAEHVAAYNRENPLNQIIRGEKGPRSSYGSSYQAQAFPAAAPAYGGGYAGNGFTGMPTQPILGFGGQAPAANTLTPAEYLKVILDGAIKGAGQGAGDAVAGTPAGQEIKKDQINSYLKEYQLPITFALLGIAGLAYKAFNK